MAILSCITPFRPCGAWFFILQLYHSRKKSLTSGDISV
ncbi:hypothetical protein B4096_1111 [Heyndrickxia coagulans]|uniref:Uncharacterized protein n=1 Tax=Heyndrickxia coagulans TaxID=1398 RepID=A0AAN0TAE3_HEYCO|nr:hypothetical protein SB48_HM08orf06245 [Heyndrickxia coagulans]KYC83982.1 hypothetical protein B4096_1111 [Heyndrickxia coagulans]